MHKLPIIVCFALLSIYACGGGGSSQSSDNQIDESEIQEVQQLDSLTVELDGVKSEIDETADELDELLKDIDQ